MLDQLIEYICLHAHSAHWMLFGLILLGGLNVPISLDLMLILGGVITTSCLDDNIWQIYPWLLTAAILAGWEAYWIGRLVGPKLYEWEWFRYVITPKRTEKLHEYYEKFGVLAFIVGRFVPGGVRNALFMTSGLGKMPFSTFVMRDAIGALVSTIPIYALGMYFGENHAEIVRYMRNYDFAIIGIIVTAIFFYLLYLKKSRR